MLVLLGGSPNTTRMFRPPLLDPIEYKFFKSIIFTSAKCRTLDIPCTRLLTSSSCAELRMVARHFPTTLRHVRYPDVCRAGTPGAGNVVALGLINSKDTKTKCRHLKKFTCKGTLRQVIIRVYRLEILSVMLVFSTQLCELLSL
jgi:hypothetical protein